MADQQVCAQQVRQEFWQTMLVPLAAFLIAGHDVRYIGVIVILNLLASVVCCLLWVFGLRKLPGMIFNYVCFAQFILNVPTGMCLYGPRQYISSNWLLDAGPMNAWEDVMISAALVYVIPLYFFFIARGWKENRFDVSIFFIALMLGTVYAVYAAVTAGWADLESLVVYFKAASLVALLFIAPHLYPGVSTRVSTMVVSIFFVGFLAGSLMALRQQLADGSAYNDTIIAEVDACKLCLGAFYLMLWCWESILPPLERHLGPYFE